MNQKVLNVTFGSFCDGSQYFLSFPRLIDKFTEMEHLKNIETLCQRLAINSDRSLDKRTYNDRENKNPKDIILVWDTGASFGLTPFRSDFIYYVEADIPVKDITKINQVVGIGTMLHKFKNDISLTFVSYHIPTTYIRLFYPQTYH